MRNCCIPRTSPDSDEGYLGTYSQWNAKPENKGRTTGDFNNAWEALGDEIAVRFPCMQMLYATHLVARQIYEVQSAKCAATVIDNSVSNALLCKRLALSRLPLLTASHEGF